MQLTPDIVKAQANNTHPDYPLHPGMLSNVALKTGLTVEACEDLLRKGWSYVEKIDCVPMWVSPMARLERG